MLPFIKSDLFCQLPLYSTLVRHLLTHVLHLMIVINIAPEWAMANYILIINKICKFGAVFFLCLIHFDKKLVEPESQFISPMLLSMSHTHVLQTDDSVCCLIRASMRCKVLPLSATHTAYGEATVTRFTSILSQPSHRSQCLVRTSVPPCCCVKQAHILRKARPCPAPLSAQQCGRTTKAYQVLWQRTLKGASVCPLALPQDSRTGCLGCSLTFLNTSLPVPVKPVK